jgi:hypothetical protein
MRRKGMRLISTCREYDGKAEKEPVRRIPGGPAVVRL